MPPLPPSNAFKIAYGAVYRCTVNIFFGLTSQATRLNDLPSFPAGRGLNLMYDMTLVVVYNSCQFVVLSGRKNVILLLEYVRTFM